MLANRVNRIGLSTTLRIAAAAKALKADGIDVVDLSIGEPDFPTPDHIKQAAKRALDANFTGYTQSEGTPELRRAIQAKLQRDNQLRYELDEILVSPGAKFSLYLAVMALTERGQDVIIPAPYWVSYPEQVRLAGANPVFVTTREEDGFRLTAKRLQQVLTFNTKLLVLNYPSNPTGTTYTREQLAELAEVCRREGLWVLADEIYEKLTYDGHPHHSIAAISPEMKKRTILVNGLSKAYAMTGWRIGYAAGPREVIGAMAKVQSHATSNPTSIAQAAAVEALNGPQSEVSRMAGEFARRRNYVVYKLRAMDGVTCDEPHGAFYLFPNVRQFYDRSFEGAVVRNSYGLAYYLLKQAHVAVIPGDAFGSPDHIRLSYATGMDRLELGMERMARALQQLEPPQDVQHAVLDNVVTKMDHAVVPQLAVSPGEIDRVVAAANRTIRDQHYFEWNAAIAGIVLQLRTNSPHLYRFYQENWYPAQLESEIEPHAVLYAAKGLDGFSTQAIYAAAGRGGAVVNSAYYGQTRAMALTIAGDLLESNSAVQLVRAAALDIGGRGLLLFGTAGSGMARALWSLLRRDGVRLVGTDAVLLRHHGKEILADLLERKLYLKTKWVNYEPRLAGLFDRSPLENALTWPHANALCSGEEDCPLTRGFGACYRGSATSRGLVDPYWLGGVMRHVKRTSVRAVAIFGAVPIRSGVQPLDSEEALSLLSNASMTQASGAVTNVPWYNEYLLDRSLERQQRQRRQFEALFQAARPYHVCATGTSEDSLADALVKLV